ncbi:hypothetical protein B7463_g2240, partial [Scytalidium lignicola]
MLQNVVDSCLRTFLPARRFYYACLVCGLLCPSFFFGAFIAADFIPPIKPWWSAERTAEHYQNHTIGIRVGAALMIFSGMFYLPYTVLISTQMNRIPWLPRGVSLLQAASGAASVFAFSLPAMVLAIAAYRPERSPEMTQMLNDMFWIFAVMPWPTFLSQNWAFAYAILVDTRAKPLFPKYMSMINMVVPLLLAPSLGLHFVKSGVVSWNGALGFWVPGVAFSIQFLLDICCLFRAIQTEDIDQDRLPVDQEQVKVALD